MCLLSLNRTLLKQEKGEGEIAIGHWSVHFFREMAYSSMLDSIGGKWIDKKCYRVFVVELTTQGRKCAHTLFSRLSVVWSRGEKTGHSGAHMVLHIICNGQNTHMRSPVCRAPPAPLFPCCYSKRCCNVHFYTPPSIMGKVCPAQSTSKKRTASEWQPGQQGRLFDHHLLSEEWTRMGKIMFFSSFPLASPHYY